MAEAAAPGAAAPPAAPPASDAFSSADERGCVAEVKEAWASASKSAASALCQSFASRCRMPAL